MQNEIVKVNFDTQTVSARELHEQLHIGTEFAKWFSRMCEYGFSTGNDYSEVIVKNDENLKGGRPATDYNISVDMAKQICMIQRTPEGKAVRQYLIDLEKAWNTPEQVMARALKIANQSIENLKTQNIALVADNDRMRPKEIFADAVAASHTYIHTDRRFGKIAKTEWSRHWAKEVICLDARKWISDQTAGFGLEYANTTEYGNGIV